MTSTNEDPAVNEELSERVGRIEAAVAAIASHVFQTSVSAGFAESDDVEELGAEGSMEFGKMCWGKPCGSKSEVEGPTGDMDNEYGSSKRKTAIMDHGDGTSTADIGHSGAHTDKTLKALGEKHGVKVMGSGTRSNVAFQGAHDKVKAAVAQFHEQSAAQNHKTYAKSVKEAEADGGDEKTVKARAAEIHQKKTGYAPTRNQVGMHWG